MAHKTDFKNALFSQRKYKQTINDDGTVSFEDVTEYTQEGDLVGADYFNEMGEAMNDVENGQIAPEFEDYGSATAPDAETAIAAIVSKTKMVGIFANVKAALLGVFLKKHIIDDYDDAAAVTEEGYATGGKVAAQLIKNITSLQTSFHTGLSQIAAAITAMGVTTASNASAETMAANIKKIAVEVITATYSSAITFSASAETRTFTIDVKKSGYTPISCGISKYVENRSQASKPATVTATLNGTTVTITTYTESFSAGYLVGTVTVLVTYKKN